MARFRIVEPAIVLTAEEGAFIPINCLRYSPHDI